MAVKAEVHSDDRTHEVKFDAEPYLVQASDKEIEELIECGWGGDYPADEVAEFFQGKNNEIEALFEHLHSIRDLRSHKDMCGFECHVDEGEAMAWVAANRPHLADDGCSGQDRESYSDDQDRESYQVSRLPKP